MVIQGCRRDTDLSLKPHRDYKFIHNKAYFTSSSQGEMSCEKMGLTTPKIYVKWSYVFQITETTR